MITWSEPNEYGEILGDGYMLAKAWEPFKAGMITRNVAADVVRVWAVYVTSPELNEADGTEVLKYRARRHTLEEAKAFAQADYDARYAL